MDRHFYLEHVAVNHIASAEPNCPNLAESHCSQYQEQKWSDGFVADLYQEKFLANSVFALLAGCLLIVDQQVRLHHLFN